VAGSITLPNLCMVSRVRRSCLVQIAAEFRVDGATGSNPLSRGVPFFF
jgi:hypothetical protein